jgi:mRNA interferase MazF
MRETPGRGRIIVVNFEKSGTATPPEMVGTQRPCVVIQNNSLQRSALVTVVPLSTTEPHRPGKQHHQMSHLSFRGWPMDWDGQGAPRWAKCDYLTTVSLSRCTDPYTKEQFGARRYIKVKVTKMDMEAVERCILWTLGIDPGSHVETGAQVGVETNVG